MSLISEALKKAQRERASSTRELAPRDKQPTIVSSSPPNPKLFRGLLIGGTLIRTLFILLLVILFKPRDANVKPDSIARSGVARSAKAVEQ